jgi:hypothetical protein
MTVGCVVFSLCWLDWGQLEVFVLLFRARLNHRCLSLGETKGCFVSFCCARLYHCCLPMGDSVELFELLSCIRLYSIVG